MAVMSNECKPMYYLSKRNENIEHHNMNMNMNMNINIKMNIMKMKMNMNMNMNIILNMYSAHQKIAYEKNHQTFQLHFTL